MRNFLAGLGGSSGAFAAAGVCVALVIAGFYIQSTRNTEQEVTPTVAVQPTQPSDKPTEAVEAAKPETVEPAQEPAEEVVVEDAAPPQSPTFDEVRRDQDGVTVVAGQGEPGSEVQILQNGQEVARATVDNAGKFAAIAMIPLDGKGHVLSLLQSVGGAEMASADEIILAPLSAPEPVEVAENTGDESKQDEPVTVEAQGEKTEENAVEAAQNETAVSEESTELAALAEPKEAESLASLQSEPASAPAETQTVEAEPSEPAEEETTVAELVAEPSIEQTVKVQETEVTSAEVQSTEVVASEQTESAAETTSAEQVSAASTTTDETQKAEAAAIPSTPKAAELSGSTQEETAAATEAASEQPAQSQQVAVLKSTEEGVELLNQPGPDVMDNVAIDTISYSDGGAVQLSGRAQSVADAVRVYLDNNAVISLPVDEDGKWRGDLPNVDAGIYTLRVDEVAADGKVTSRVETPFKREEPEVLANAAAQKDGLIKAITVQKGATLWAIARDRYGDGQLFVRVFEANRDDIRDPDLIYPGQIFDLPD